MYSDHCNDDHEQIVSTSPGNIGNANMSHLSPLMGLPVRIFLGVLEFYEDAGAS